MKRAILKACAVLLCNMAFFCAVRGATISGGGLAATGGHNWVGRGVIEYEEGEGKTYSLIIRVFADDGRTNARSVTMKWSGETSLTFNAADYASVGYTIKVFVEGGAATSMVVGSRYVPPNVDPSQRVFVLCDLKIENTTGAENLEGWVEINGTRYGPAPVGGLEQTIELGAFEPGTVIPITYGSGVTGSPSSYTVPNSPGEQVSFSVNATTGGAEQKGTMKYKIDFINNSPERSCQVMLMGANLNWTISPQAEGGNAQRVQGTASVEEGTVTTLVVPIYWTARGVGTTHQVFYTNGVDNYWEVESPVELDYTGPSYRNITVSLKLVDHTTGNKKVTIMKGGEALVDALSKAGDTTTASWGGEANDGETIWLTTNDIGLTITKSPSNGVVSADNTHFEFEAVYYGEDGPPVEPPNPPVEPPPEPPEPPEGVDPGNGAGSVEPGGTTPPKGGSDVLDAVKNLEKTVTEEGQKGRAVMADGFNKVNQQIYNNTVTNLEALRRVQESVQNTEYAIRDEAVKTRNADKENLENLKDFLTPKGSSDAPGKMDLPSEVNVVSVEVETKLEKINVLKKLSSELPLAEAPVFDLSLNLGVTTLDIYADFGQEQYRQPVSKVRALFLYVMAFAFVYILMKVIGKAWGA